MGIDEIETFVAIAELGGFTRASQKLHRTQPAISRRLSLLEQELGVPLFERIRGHARLTEAGHVFLPHAEAVLAALKDGREAVRAAESDRVDPDHPLQRGDVACAILPDHLGQIQQHAQAHRHRSVCHAMRG